MKHHHVSDRIPLYRQVHVTQAVPQKAFSMAAMNVVNDTTIKTCWESNNANIIAVMLCPVNAQGMSRLKCLHTAERVVQ